MKKQDAITLFHSMHPDFFAQECIQSLSEEWVYAEMLLRLEEFDANMYNKELDAGVTFGIYEGEHAKLLKAVEQVDPNWVEFFNEDDEVFCGYYDDKIASFCIIAPMGTHMINGQAVKIGGPGCVGTLPEYRNLGIGLTMVKKATRILKEEGYDYSYIHYTAVESWYVKLGYERILKWTKNGF